MQPRKVSPDKLISARQRAGYPSQAKAARDMDISRSRLNNWERGVAQPGASELAMLSDFYGCTMDSLMELEVE